MLLGNVDAQKRKCCVDDAIHVANPGCQRFAFKDDELAVGYAGGDVPRGVNGGERGAAPVQNKCWALDLAQVLRHVEVRFEGDFKERGVLGRRVPHEGGVGTRLLT